MRAQSLQAGQRVSRYLPSDSQATKVSPAYILKPANINEDGAGAVSNTYIPK